MFQQLDHIAIVVSNTDEALTFYRDVLGLPVVLSEVVNDPPVKLTHLDMGNTHLQLVEPIGDDHPLQEYLRTHGEGLHHLCFQVESVTETIPNLPDRGLAPRSPAPHSGPNGRKAGFIDPATTRGVLIEFTSEETEP